MMMMIQSSLIPDDIFFAHFVFVFVFGEPTTNTIYSIIIITERKNSDDNIHGDHQLTILSHSF